MIHSTFPVGATETFIIVQDFVTNVKKVNSWQLISAKNLIPGAVGSLSFGYIFINIRYIFINIYLYAFIVSFIKNPRTIEKDFK